ncbi:alcohol dehydrogenase catalytic domain-containing protein [Megasphaera paucivorans]|uniref:L-threonine 3-dehydrogenase n=1 Tax=Megasphaera paucivorans TaxID=349095 RepID=A0A1H0C2J5_9FIRM|nr:alcohol dehydrogenase catalytic domain-containing protein [Megasphaera paucivorans]SDN52138.1 L-threonine 3-dehydrogenase [Megasphaera paucivorans]
MKKTMKCVIKSASGVGNIKLVERPIPEVGPNDVLVKVKAVAVCGTDVHIMDWTEWAAKRMNPPSIIGHEFSGQIIKKGELVKQVQIGDAVAAETHIVCHTCDLCHNGCEHVCYNTETIGASRDGALAEYVAIPAENAVVFKKFASWEILSLMEPFVAAVHAVTQFSISGKTVGVIGCGPIGCMGILIAKKCGASKVIAIEPIEQRGNKALEVGADILINPITVNIKQAVQDANDGDLIDIVLDFSGNVGAIQDCMTYIKPEGKIAILGLSEKKMTFKLDEFVYRGLTLKGIAGRRMYRDWETAKGLLAGGLDLSKIITHKLPMVEFQKGLELMKTGKCCKCVLIP